MWQPPTDDLLDAYGERLLTAVRRCGVRRLFIDGLGALQMAAGNEPNRMARFLTALMNELRVREVTTLYTLEVPDIMEPTIRTPIGDLSSLAENLILLRFVELRSRLHRLISLLKVRDSPFDSSLHEYVTSAAGLVIEPAADSAEWITAGYPQPKVGPLPLGPPSLGSSSPGYPPHDRRGRQRWERCWWWTTRLASPS